MRRLLLALTVSVAVHLLMVAIAIGTGIWQTMSLVPAIKVQAITVEVKELPLGAPVPAEPEPSPEPAPRARRVRHHVAAAHDGVTVPSAPDAGPAPVERDAGVARAAPDGGGGSSDGGRRRPGDLRENGPDGSRLIALLRLDRLRETKGHENTIAALDQLLLLLPDRRRLIEGSGLDLYRDFDTLLVATPNPADDAVTFLAVRHHLTEAALKAGLDRGAKAAKKPIEWLVIGGRPVGLRRQPAGGGTTGQGDRDDRIIAMPQPALAIMATTAYASLLLDMNPSARASATPTVDGGATDALAAGTSPRRTVSRTRWQTIASRIEAEESAMPDDAAFMMMATGLFTAPSGPPGYLVPGSRGAADDQPPQAVGSEPAAPPQTLNLVVGAAAPYIEVGADFATAAEADRWERDLPTWRRKLALNPVVILSGFASLINRAEASREGNTLRLRLETSPEELQRLLNLVANLTRTALAQPR